MCCRRLADVPQDNMLDNVEFKQALQLLRHTLIQTQQQQQQQQQQHDVSQSSRSSGRGLSPRSIATVPDALPSVLTTLCRREQVQVPAMSRREYAMYGRLFHETAQRHKTTGS